MSDIISAVLQGVIQGLTEFLPISSSGHLAIYQHLFGSTADDNLLFTTLLHVGTLFAVCLVYRKAIWELICELFRLLGDLFTGKIRKAPMTDDRRTVLMMILSSALLIIGLLPVFGGHSMKNVCEVIETDENLFWMIGVALIATSVLMFVAWRITTSNRPTHHCATVKDAVLVGLTQLASAMLPGLSRSGSTAATALACGMEKSAATRYSFILSIPAVAGATLLELKEALELGSAQSLNWVAAVVGVVTAALVGIAAIKTFLWLVKNNRYIVFAIYCALVGAGVVIWSIVE